MSRSVKFASILGLLALVANLALALVPATVALAAAPSWNQLDTGSCTVFKLSDYWPGRAFCYKTDPATGEPVISLVSLKDSSIAPVDVLRRAYLLYEDGATGFILALSYDGTFFRLGNALTPDTRIDLLHESAGELSSTSVFPAGYATGTFYLRYGISNIWYSSFDNGRTWQRYAVNGDDPAVVYEMHFSEVNPDIVYGLSRLVKETASDESKHFYKYILKSTDRGRTFSRVGRTPETVAGSSIAFSDIYLYLSPAPSRDSSQLYLKIYTYVINYSTYKYYHSSDGGVTFKETGQATGGRGSEQGFMYFAPDGTVLQAAIQQCYADGSCSLSSEATRSLDNGETFQPAGKLPNFILSDFYLPRQSINTYYALARQVGRSMNDPVKVLLPRLVRSTDGGTTWVQLPDQGAPDLSSYGFNLLISNYSPTTLVVVIGSKVNVLEDEVAGQVQTHGIAPNPGQDYFDATRHNMALFKDYWYKNGGLAQFGYTKTEVFREVNPSDGNIYYVQYFERNRFEYHPENKGSPYEVLLGLLGNQLTAGRAAAGEGAFNRFSNANYPGGSFFPETGHNLRNSFKQYWEQNGGLFIYGYPISEEFSEVNPDDGNIYVVQYFERARFEWHPENKGTKYEVLLGLLGNTLLRQKSWL